MKFFIPLNSCDLLYLISQSPHMLTCLHVLSPLLQGEPGAIGDIGARGPRGPTGYIGATGSRGPKGAAVC